MDTIVTENDSNLNINDDRLILYAIGELTADEMADIDEYALAHPEINEKIEALLEVVDLLETSPELQLALSDTDKLSDFLEFLVSFGKALWPWSGNGNASLWETINQKYQEWTQKSDPIKECGEALGTSFMNLSSAFASFDCFGSIDSCYDGANTMYRARIVPEYIPNSPDGFTAEKKNVFLTAADTPFSTFGLDVDTASYNVAKEYINDFDQLPPPESVREEEFINYFDWELPQPEENSVCPFRPTVEIGRHPLKPGMLLVKIGVQGRSFLRENIPPLNLTYLIDVSGSMDEENKLELIKKSLCNQVDFLREEDSISIVTYSDTAKVVLDSTPIRDREEIKSVIKSLSASGCTNASDGLVLAYRENKKQFNAQGVNRIVLCSDGDFNVGITDSNKLQSLIKQQAQSGVFLLVLGFGMGNYKDNTMETLANYGQGSYHYINNKKEARRILEDENFGSMMTIAKDVKIQIDFNPARVHSYRLIGYENRVMEDQDFNDDTQESGNIGAGQNVLALYEIVPVGAVNELEPSVDRSRYEKFHQPQQDKAPNSEQASAFTGNDPLLNELFLLKIRWKSPDSDKSQEQEFPINAPTDDEKVSSDFRFAYAVALFAQILAKGKYTGGAKFNDVLNLVPENRNEQQEEFIRLVEMAKRINS